jgi:hypothetical protein
MCSILLTIVLVLVVLAILGVVAGAVIAEKEIAKMDTRGPRSDDDLS